MYAWRILPAAVTAAAIGGGAHAQVPGPANPNRVQERFQPPSTPGSVPSITVPAPEAAPPPDEAGQIRFVLHTVVVDGSTVFVAADFAPLDRPFLSKEVSLLDIYRLRDTITAKYRRAGYVLSQAIIPPQQIVDGVVHIQIVEGYIGEVSFEGDALDRRGLVKAMAEHVTRTRPVRERDLERYVLLIGDLPGVTVNTVLRPASGTPGAAELVVVVRRKPVDGSASVDNRGSTAIGPVEYFAGLNVNSAFEFDEQTGVEAATASATRELHYIALHHDEYLDAEGLKLDLSAVFSQSRSGGAIEALDPLGKSQTYSIHLSEPLIRTRAQSLTVGMAFSAPNNTTDLLQTEVGDDRLRVLSGDFAYDVADTLFGDARPASTLVSGVISHGLDALGARRTGSPGLSRANGTSDFNKFNGQAIRIQSVTPTVSLAIAVDGQYSRDPLLSSEQFGLGGSQFGRGYEPSELLGDSGVGVSLEWRWSPAPVSKRIPVPQFYAFYDAGVVWLNDPLPGERPRASLAAGGAGVRLSLLKHFTADLELAKPLTKPIASRGDKELRPLFALATVF